MTIKAVVFDIGGVLERVDDASWPQRWMAGWEGRLGLDEADTDELIREMWDAYCGELDRELFDYFVSLRANCKIGILSNSGDGARREEQRRFGFQDVTDDIVYSHEVGLAKPDPKIYALTSDRLGVLPDEIVFLDDLETNVQAARELGWHALVHRDTATSISTIGELVTA